MNVKINRLASLLDAVVENYFVKGEMPQEVAFANIILAREYAGVLCGNELDDHRIDFYEENLAVATEFFSKDGANR